MRWCGLALLSLLFAPSAAAQCTIEGDARIDDVTPRGTDLHFGVEEHARVTLDGVRARVEGLRPIAFVGAAASRDVALFLAADRTVQGVISVRAGTPLRVRRVDGARAAGFVDAGLVRLPISVPCGALSLTPEAPPPAADTSDEGDATLLVRARSLSVYAGPTTFRGVRLALRDGAPISEWPWLTARGHSGARVRVTAVLADGVTIDGWVERTVVQRPSSFTSSSCCCMGGGTMCGHGYAGETYRGAARVAAGAELRDGDDRVWGHVVEDTAATVAISAFTVTSHPIDAPPEVRRIETVWLETIPGLVFDSCSSPSIHLDRDAVTIPSP